MAIGIGSVVTVKAPFNDYYVGTFIVNGRSESPNVWQINGVDFAEEHLEEVM